MAWKIQQTGLKPKQAELLTPEKITTTHFRYPVMDNKGGVVALKSGLGEVTAIVKIKDGKYKVGIRPHNITTYKEGSNSVEIKGKVLISELSGSESLIHFTNSNSNWVSLSNGTHQMNVGQEAKLYMNVDEFMYFDQNNNLINYV